MKNPFSKNNADVREQEIETADVPVLEESADFDEMEAVTANFSEAPMAEQLKASFDAAYYLSVNPDVLAAGLDPLKHYMVHGWRENRRPNDWFNPVEYIARHGETLGDTTNPFIHFLTHQGSEDVVLEANLQTLRRNVVLYWTDRYKAGENDIVRPLVLSSSMPTKESLALVAETFDAKYYLEQNPEIKERSIDPLLHFMTLGWVENRDPSPDFSMTYYLKRNNDVRRAGVNPYTHYLKSGFREKWRQFATVKEARVFDLFEDGMHLGDKLAQAKSLEPMVAMPNEPRRITTPLVAGVQGADVVKALRTKLEGKTYKYIVTVPHVRMSGASRVASIFADALAQVRDPSDILVITTDSSENEYIDWFSDKLDILDLSQEIEPLNQDGKIRAMIDLMRGVGCQTIVNVNSRLMWEVMRAFGRQLHHEFRIVTYLFTWDENANGDRVGYPIQWLRDTADHHHLLLTDSKNLADDVANRLGFSQEGAAAQIKWLHTPVTGEAAVAVRDPARPKAGRFLWAGRFDPQKRLDILIEIARANPDMIFDVYGKTVLGNKDLAAYNPPPNIIPQGTYTDLKEVLETSYDGFLYTAQWDGIPTILLDMGSAGLPIVAPDVGGISELLDDTTGWLIEDFEDVDGYGAALSQMVQDRSEADTRAAALQTRLADRFNIEGYVDSIKKVVTTYDL